MSQSNKQPSTSNISVGVSNSGPKVQVSSKGPSPTPIASNEETKPTKKIPQVGLAKGPDLKNCKSKVGSLHNIKHIPAGGGVVIPTKKLEWNATSKVGSLENKKHKPGGGRLVVESRKLEWKTSSKVQSLANINHKPGGGNIKIFNETYVRSKSSDCKSRSSTPSETGDSKVDENTITRIGGLNIKN